MASIIQIRRDTASAWTSTNPTLAQGELALETDTLKLKAGDGTTTWTSLAYYTLGAAGFLATADIGTTVQAYDATIVVDADIGTTVQAYDAETSKLDVAETRSASINMADNIFERPVLKDYAETKVAMAANDADLSLGNVQTKTISGATTLTFSNPPAAGSSGSFTLFLTNGGSAAVTWPTGVDWPTATAPTLTATGVDVLVFTTIDAGTTWYGIASGIGMG
jgi:hypothetical protein